MRFFRHVGGFRGASPEFSDLANGKSCSEYVTTSVGHHVTSEKSPSGV